MWPGEAVYPDYLAAPNVDSWIKGQLQRFYNEVPFDGLWLDMNEASNFCSGRACRSDPKNETATKCKGVVRTGRAPGWGWADAEQGSVRWSQQV